MPRAGVLQGRPEIIEKIAEEWGAMCAANPGPQPFCRPEWTRAYCRAFAPRAALLLISARFGGRLGAVLPLIAEDTSFYGLPARKLTGAASFFYQFDAAWGSKGEKEPAMHAIWQALKELPGWDVIELPHIRQEAELGSVFRAAQMDGYPTGCREVARSAFIPITGWDGDPDYWLLRCGRHFRHTFRTAARKLPAGAELVLRDVRTADGGSLRAFLDLERSGWKGKGGSAIDCDNNKRQFFTELAEAAARAGYLSLYFLELNGLPIAAHFGFALGQRYYTLKCAFDERYRACAPGHLIVNAILQDCARRSLLDLELGPTSEWKSKWTSQSHPLTFLYIFRKSAYGRLLHSARFKIIAGVKTLLEGSGADRAALRSNGLIA
jgi:CelD/BcsL family acetyltransferase involved in cellulose biosynthesis